MLFKVRQEKTANTPADLGFHGAHVSLWRFCSALAKMIDIIILVLFIFEHINYHYYYYYFDVATIDGYDDNTDDDVVDNDMKMKMMMMILKDIDEMKQLKSAKIFANYFQHLGDSLLLPKDLINVQAVLAEEFIEQKKLI